MRRHIYMVERNDPETGYTMHCGHCKDALRLKGEDLPFWLFVALQEAFAAEHELCPTKSTNTPILSTISYERNK